MKEFLKILYEAIKVYFKKDTWKFDAEDKHDLYLVMLICMGFTFILWLVSLSIFAGNI